MTLLLISLSVGMARGQTGVTGDSWPYWGGDAGSTHYSPLDQITADNAGKLQIAWRWKASTFRNGDPDRNLQATPIMVGDTLYTSAGVNGAAAIDAATGETVWTFTPSPDEVSVHPVGWSGRGLSYWSDGQQTRVYRNTSDGRLIALDAKTGKPCSDFGDNGYVDLRKELSDFPNPRIGSSSPGIVVGDVIVVQVVPSAINPTIKEAVAGHIRGYDVRSGKRLWTFHTIPQAGEFGNETWENGSWKYTGNAGVWCLMSADPKLGYVYLPIEAATHDFYGGHRLGDNLFSESLVCLDVTTGKRVWHFQLTHHGLWDYDPPTAPILCDITVDGQAIKAVAQLSKQGFVYVFDRVTGKPVWPIEERPVPSSDVPGERASPTQPFPTRPAPFERQGVSENDLIDFTPELKAEAVKIMQNYRIGPLFTPPVVADGKPGSLKGTLMLPGYGGGANWPGGGFDPETQTLYVPSRTTIMSSSVGIVADRARSNLDFSRSETTIVPGPRGLPLAKPPWSRITAINMNTGEHKWMVPGGQAPADVRNHPDLQNLGIDFSKLGNSGRPGVLVTKTLLFTSDSGGLRSNPGTPYLRVLNKDTGALVAEVNLPAPPSGVPMCYSLGGKQYIAVAVADRRNPAEIVALCLP